MKGRKTLLIVAALYGTYSIGRGLWGIAGESSTQTRVLLAICFCAVLSLVGFAVYKLIKRKED